jgi:hypothetical protein
MFLLFIFFTFYFKQQNWGLFTEKSLVISDMAVVGAWVVEVGGEN